MLPGTVRFTQRWTSTGTKTNLSRIRAIDRLRRFYVAKAKIAEPENNNPATIFTA